MNVRDLKLSVACGNASEEVISLNKFFDDLFNDTKIIKKEDGTIWYFKGDKCLMISDFKGIYSCRYEGFREILLKQYQCAVEEIHGIIKYKVEEYFGI